MNVWGKSKSDNAAPTATAVTAAAPAEHYEGGGGGGGGGAGAPITGPGATGAGRVKAVLSGDSFVVWVQRAGSATPEEVQITLSLLSAPRIARGKDAGTDQPWAWQSREALRKVLQAKQVQYRIDYTHPTSGRQYAFVKTSEGANVNLLVAASGWARVQEPKQGKGPRGPEHVAMLEASAKAQELKQGIYNDDVEAANRSIRDVKEKFDSWKLYEDIKERLPVHGVVEGVLDGTTVRVLLVPSFYSIVVRLAGVQSPIWTRGGGGGGQGQHHGGDGEGSMRTAQPFAEQAKYLTEFCLLGRDVSVNVGGVNKDETFYGTVLFGGKNVAEELLKNGLARFVQWSCADSEASKFVALENQAQSKGVGLHKGSASQAKAKDFQATVIDVRSGSRLTVETDDLASYDIFFSSVIAPKLNPKNAKEDEPCGFEAREFLRKKLIGKKVRVAFDYEKPARADGDDQPPRKFYSVYLQGKHVPLLMVEQGLGQVITHRREEPRSREYSALMAAEELSKKALRGIWDPKHEIKRVVDQSNMRGPQAKQYLKFVQPQGGLTAIVEFVMNPVRLKLYVPELSSFISFTVAAVRSPWADDEFGEEACAWARRHFHQRKLEIDVQTVDKGGNFLGDAFFRKQNVALTLLEEGWASVSRGSERHPSIALYIKAEAAAQAAKKGIWRNYVPVKEAEHDGMASAGVVLEGAAASVVSASGGSVAAAGGEAGASETCQLLVTEVTDGSCFYCQRVSDEHQKKLEALMGELQKVNGGVSVPPVRKWARNDLACVRYAEDGLWYRVRLVEGPSDKRFKIHYLDFGNSEVRLESDFRTLPPSLAAVPPQVIRCRLALLRVPALVQDCGVEAVQALKELCFGRVLMASVEFREGEDYHVTLGDLSSGININKELVRLGLATVRQSSKMHKRFQKPLAQLLQAQEEAKRARLCLWRYGDILDQDDDDEDNNSNSNRRF